MIAALWLGTYLLHSTVLCGSVLLFRRMLRRVDGAEHIWRAAMLLPLVSATAVQAWGVGLWTIGIAGQPDTGTSNPAGFAAVASLIAVACFTIGALLTLRDRVAHVLFVRNLGKRTPVDSEVTRQVADLLRSRRGRPIVMTSAPGAVSPMVLGRREICMPTRATRDLTHEQLRALVAHEVAHVIRNDGFWFAAMAYLESALVVQPLNRIARRELRHLAELSCDEWAARRVSDPMAVARCLIVVATWSRRSGPTTVPAAASSPKGLTERVQRLIEPRVSPVRRALLPSLLVLCLASVAMPGFTMASLFSGERSPHYLRGYELGRAYAARNGVSASGGGGQAGGMGATFKEREALERRLRNLTLSATSDR